MRTVGIALVAATLLTSGCSSSEPVAGPLSSGSRSSPPTTLSRSATPKPSEPSEPTPDRIGVFHHQPLWPFGSSDEADAWLANYRRDGHQPWHLDAGQTALNFTRSRLGYTEIDRVISRVIKGSDARISVGFGVEGQNSTAAVVHLVRYGAANDSPWEVVGTDDTQLSLSTPRYAALVSSPVVVGGRITGVDESLDVIVLGQLSPSALGETRGLPAGGQNRPWTTKVAFRRSADRVLIIAVSTGGHVQRVERFAVTGVRPST